jgi:hypothetical protein
MIFRAFLPSPSPTSVKLAVTMTMDPPIPPEEKGTSG